MLVPREKETVEDSSYTSTSPLAVAYPRSSDPGLATRRTRFSCLGQEHDNPQQMPEQESSCMRMKSQDFWEREGRS